MCSYMSTIILGKYSAITKYIYNPTTGSIFREGHIISNSKGDSRTQANCIDSLIQIRHIFSKKFLDFNTFLQ
jgi:hypothetical protein